MSVPRRGEFCEEHFSWLCQAGQGQCQKVGTLVNFGSCAEGVTRKGEFQPCEKTAVAVRRDPEEGSWYGVCIKHTRRDMVPLSKLLVAFARGWDSRGESA